MCFVRACFGHLSGEDSTTCPCVCLSVRPSVSPSVCPSVCLSESTNSRAAERIVVKFYAEEFFFRMGTLFYATTVASNIPSARLIYETVWAVKSL